MPNPFFRFKQFTVYHDACAMKVGTDGVLLGAWVPIRGDEMAVLDIGTGSGLIALMLAQRCTKATIKAIDIDEGAVRQSQQNFTNSPWPHRLSVQQIAVQALAHQGSEKFDLIVSNPPFFVNSFKNPNQQRATARHTDSLSFAHLIQSASALLSPDGLFAVIIPIEHEEALLRLAFEHALFLRHKTTVLPKEGASAKRVLLALSYERATPTVTSLTIEEGVRHVYTPAFRQLTHPFYLKSEPADEQKDAI